jgi:hypothetical protein
MKITVYTLYIGDYLGEIAKHTLPSIERWANKIGANFQLIQDRKYPDWPITYEKVQIYELSKQNNDDWSIHVDADMLLHPDLPNLIENLDPRAVSFHVAYDPSVWFKADEFFFRDGRQIGLTSNFVAASKACRDLWMPFDCCLEEASKGTKRMHGIDDYCFSRNLARYGLKTQGMLPDEDKQYMVRHLNAGGQNASQELLKEVETVLKSWQKD